MITIELIGGFKDGEIIELANDSPPPVLKFSRPMDNNFVHKMEYALNIINHNSEGEIVDYKYLISSELIVLM